MAPRLTFWGSLSYDKWDDTVVQDRIQDIGDGLITMTYTLTCETGSAISAYHTTMPRCLCFQDSDFRPRLLCLTRSAWKT